LQGVDPSNVDAVEKLVLDKLAEMAASGFSAGAVEAAINTIEFSLPPPLSPLSLPLPIPMRSLPANCTAVTPPPNHTQGVDPSNVDAVEKLVLDKLAEMAKSGFSAGAVEAAINTIEFSLRENNTGSFPRGLSLMLRAMGAWIYDRDPYTPIQVCFAASCTHVC
jgi:Zn-dependent M16 (insulinase) family peptidase